MDSYLCPGEDNKAVRGLEWRLCESFWGGDGPFTNGGVDLGSKCLTCMMGHCGVCVYALSVEGGNTPLLAAYLVLLGPSSRLRWEGDVGWR
jgi:hypothetical protein